MNKYLKDFLHRGLIFGGFGPVILGIVFLILSFSIENFLISGTDIFLGIVSTYILAFVQAGTSVFNQIESWPLAKSLLCHLGSLYLVYVFCYIINSWIPFEPIALLIFTAIFFIGYFLIWIIVYITIKLTSKKINQKLAK